MNKNPLEKPAGGNDSFFAQMKEFYESKKRREQDKPKKRSGDAEN